MIVQKACKGSLDAGALPECSDIKQKIIQVSATSSQVRFLETSLRRKRGGSQKTNKPIPKEQNQRVLVSNDISLNSVKSQLADTMTKESTFLFGVFIPFQLMLLPLRPSSQEQSRLSNQANTMPFSPLDSFAAKCRNICHLWEMKSDSCMKNRRESF